jgi:hypothetical protein
LESIGIFYGCAFVHIYVIVAKFLIATTQQLD